MLYRYEETVSAFASRAKPHLCPSCHKPDEHPSSPEAASILLADKPKARQTSTELLESLSQISDEVIGVLQSN